jgi:EAL domain-containing protein (putative c-di-GMP-specific phosphodiesterase class I)
VECLADPAFDGLRLSVNLATHDLHDPQLDQALSRLLKGRAVDSARLTLELTESGLLEPGDDPVTLLSRLKQVGVRLAIDDFGTGHSSLAYLQRLPIDELKIDRSFVRDVDTSQRRRELLSTIVQLGHNLGMTVTAEGVEREAELQVVRHAGCELVQGYFTGRPMPRAEFLRWRSQSPG